MTSAGMLKVYNTLGSKGQLKVLKVVEEQRVAHIKARRAAKRALPPRTAAGPDLQAVRAAKG
jgi:hypothetical protein